MSLTLRNIKGSPLTYTELDNNFITLSAATSQIVQLELTQSDMYNLNDQNLVVIPSGSTVLIEGVYIDPSNITSQYQTSGSSQVLFAISTQTYSDTQQIASTKMVTRNVIGTNSLGSFISFSAGMFYPVNTNFYLYTVFGSSELRKPIAGDGNVKIIIKYKTI
jgi:hypothetical protein